MGFATCEQGVKIAHFADTEHFMDYSYRAVLQLCLQQMCLACPETITSHIARPHATRWAAHPGCQLP